MILNEHHNEVAIKAFAKFMPCKQAGKAFVQEFPDDQPNPSQPENTNIKRDLRNRKIIEIKTKSKFCWITSNRTKTTQAEIQNIYESIGYNTANPYHQRHISRYQIPEFKNVPILKTEISKNLHEIH